MYLYTVERINIHGHIGPSYVDEAGILQKGVELVDIISAVKGTDSLILQFSVKSPGGYVEMGNQIYDYLMSLKKEGRQIHMYQDGLVGSIATKIFMAGDVREVDPLHEFFIHNPWMVPESGDSDKLREQADALDVTEKELRKFYASHTNISDEGLDALMKNETSLTAEQAVKLGFATRVKSLAFALITTKNKMAEKKTEVSFMEHVQAFFTKKEEPKKKGVAPKAQKPENQINNLVVMLADGAGSFWVEGESVQEGMAAFLLDADGQPTQEPLPDGDYALEDGSMVSVADGKISAMTPAEESEAEVPGTFSQEQFDEAVNAAVTKALEEQAKAVDELKNEVLAFKKDVKLGIAPKRAVMTAQKVEEPKKKTITQVMAEKREERKQQLNRK